MKKIRVGICGLGSMGMHHALMLCKHENAELVAAADMEEAKRLRAKEELHVSQIFADGRDLIRNTELDAVWVCVPTYLHAEFTALALEHGRHVFCEKPMARTPEECAIMQNAAEKSGKFLMIGQVLRFWPEYVFLKEAVSGGRYGKLLTLSMTRVGGVSTGYENWFLDEARGGTQIFDRHIHDTDAILWICGKPESVRVTATVKDRSTDGGAVHTFTDYHFPGGPTVHAEGSADMPKGFPFTAAYRAVFENACVEFNSRNAETLKVYHDGIVETPELPKAVEESGSGLNISSALPYFAEQCYFFDCILKGRKPETVTPEAAAETVKTVRAEMVSEKTGETVKL
ncbi:MAG: Gfo/Idh/MocA family oxidoreductase [Lentisphaeria bacterium]|nr:Gfo/Idh/MocA family oxidoreductase [Lentisphaeria bacterium]